MRSVMTAALIKYYSVDEMKEDKTVGVCGSYGEI
jgi:hypothetical protein